MGVSYTNRWDADAAAVIFSLSSLCILLSVPAFSLLLAFLFLLLFWLKMNFFIFSFVCCSFLSFFVRDIARFFLDLIFIYLCICSSSLFFLFNHVFKLLFLSIHLFLSNENTPCCM